MGFTEVSLLAKDIFALKQFYRDTLDFKLYDVSHTSFAIQAGSTRVRFDAATTNIDPCYHFAFNVPENKFDESKAWLKNRVPLIPYNGLEDVFYNHWNAHACYFYDPAGNILEFIGRHNLNNADHKSFHSNRITEVSEIGMPTKDIAGLYSQIHSKTRMQLYDGNLMTFAATGDEQGLIIIVNEGKHWVPTNTPAQGFPVRVELSTGEQLSYAYNTLS